MRWPRSTLWLVEVEVAAADSSAMASAAVRCVAGGRRGFEGVGDGGGEDGSGRRYPSDGSVRATRN
jgi:hypothetical protein